MATGIVDSRRALLLRLAWRIEGRFPDVEECTTEGGGIEETRPEYLRIYRHTEIRMHPDGTPFALIVDDEAREQLAAEKADCAAKVASGTADQEDADIDALPAEAELDETWFFQPVP